MQTEVSPPDVITHIQSVVVAVGGAALLQLFGSLSVHICLSAAHLAAFQPSWSDPPPEQTASEPLPASRCVSIILLHFSCLLFPLHFFPFCRSLHPSSPPCFPVTRGVPVLFS